MNIFVYFFQICAILKGNALGILVFIFEYFFLFSQRYAILKGNELGIVV